MIFIFLLFLTLLLLYPGGHRYRFNAKSGTFRPAKRLATVQRSRRKPDWVVPALIHLKAVMPQAGCRQLADTFNRLHAEHQVSVGKT